MHIFTEYFPERPFKDSKKGGIYKYLLYSCQMLVSKNMSLDYGIKIIPKYTAGRFFRESDKYQLNKHLNSGELDFTNITSNPQKELIFCLKAEANMVARVSMFSCLFTLGSTSLSQMYFCTILCQTYFVP